MLLLWRLWGGQGSREVRSFVLDEASLQERYASKSPLYKDDVLAGDWYGPFLLPHDSRSVSQLLCAWEDGVHSSNLWIRIEGVCSPIYFACVCRSSISWMLTPDEAKCQGLATMVRQHLT
jgi:hypothetical protein